ncbi:aminotransferase class I/II-fold pyridoxal phosphate-dependent enzyme [Oceanobacillus alkalisoli]|uniref:aminotransferase class I/II-fold pyridoxal phosphate-dependent enzyme n=1 Tax=Oceanobacillus alkalisoli TaxID=2925113 RepID=UPI001EE44DE6|nr:aminotransferase class I/II-fold pyridoxal phosphate-dependent enzyme [Oceanobacillus alkalisoli]MCG5102325.1 aminotransferase class I/II-fold pyridoxal phosphate-dependent enzyme [Oceanobacillus alkalisoli]
MITVADKVKNLPAYVFSEFQHKKAELERKGVDVIDLGIGAPDLPTPDFVYERLVLEAKNPANHRYSPYSGCSEFKEAVAEFYKKQYDVDLDPDKEILALIGSKEGIANLFQAVLNPGDAVFVPDPGYPIYTKGVLLAGGESILLPLHQEAGYIPQFGRISKKNKQRAKILLLNYPSNPLGATIELNTFKEAATFSKNNNILLVNDAAYDLITFDDYKAPSVLQVPGAKDLAVEFGSLSKSFNMTGWRIGYVVGNKNIIKALTTLKSNIDSSQFLAVQKAAATALRSDLAAVREHNAIYQERMERLHTALNELGIYTEKTRGTIFLWAKVPAGFTSKRFANKLLEEAGVIVTPGTAFGPTGEGYIRIALTVSTARLDEVVHRLRELRLKGEYGS